MISTIHAGSPSAFFAGNFNPGFTWDRPSIEENMLSGIAEMVLEKMKRLSSRIVFQRNTIGTYAQSEIVVSSELDSEFFSPAVPFVPQFASAPTGWLVDVLQLLAEGREDAALKEISLVTTRLKVTDDLAQLRDGLREVEFDNLPDVVMVGLLRNVFSVRAQIEEWNSLVSRAEQLLIKRNRNPRALLRGLKNFSKIGTP